MKGREKIPGRRCDVPSSKKSCGGLKRPSFASAPSTSAHERTTRPTPYQFNVSTHVRSAITSPAKKYESNGYNHSRRLRCVSKKGKSREAVVSSKWAKQKRRSGYSPQYSRPKIQNQTDQYRRTAQSISGQDITSYQWLYYGAYIGNETRTIEFKRGGTFYMRTTFGKDVGIYGCAFLNSGGGTLLVGVCDNGMVCGMDFSHKDEDKTRLQVDWIVKHFHPRLLPYNYSLNFLPVVKPGKKRHHLKVLCLTFIAPPSFTEPTLFWINRGKVYMRRDGSVQGPLEASVILEWSRQMWTSKVQQLNQYLHEVRSEKWFLAGQVNGLLKCIHPLHQIIASLKSQTKTAPSRQHKRKVKHHLKSSVKQNSQTSASLSPVGSPDARPANNTEGLELPLKSECRQL